LQTSQSSHRSGFLRQMPCSQTPHGVSSQAGSVPIGVQYMPVRPRESGKPRLHVVHGPQISPARSQRSPRLLTFASALLRPMAESTPLLTAAANPFSAPRRETCWASVRAISSNRRSSNALLLSANTMATRCPSQSVRDSERYDYLNGESISDWSRLRRPCSVGRAVARSEPEVVFRWSNRTQEQRRAGRSPASPSLELTPSPARWIETQA
jgi:hypothetical protein